MPGKTKAPKNSGSKAKKVTKKVVEEAPVVETPVVETPVVETPVSETPVVEVQEDDGYDQEFLEIQEQLKSAMNLIKTLTSNVSKLEKRVSRDRKVMNKKMRGKKPRVHDPNKPPSGFAKPGPISPELAKFLELPKDELIARTEVTRKITEYCKKHDLQKKEDGRHILPDKALKKLLNIKDGEELTFFNLQKYMKVHYPKKVVAA
jgi:chromatin remodeling complex protein RSC6|tara:strand:- start:3165 stop:3779 length:615 start_codon:yes stop_codon:yes gene_type:complete